MIKHEGLYHFIYSANDFRNPNYVVGYAEGESPMGFWTKSTSNLISDNADDGINASGHGDFFVESEGKLRYVLDINNSKKKVSPRKKAFIELEFKEDGNELDLLEVKKESFKFLELN
ncbi:MAG: hypothetical protein O3B47_04795 [bacterium]|nr:hypothetical protein [bacterium]